MHLAMPGGQGKEGDQHVANQLQVSIIGWAQLQVCTNTTSSFIQLVVVVVHSTGLYTKTSRIVLHIIPVRV